MPRIGSWRSRLVPLPRFNSHVQAGSRAAMETVTIATVCRMVDRQTTEPSQSEIRSRLRAWVRYFMDENRWDQQAFADAINVSRPTITNILNDKRPMGLKSFVKMHYHLGGQSGFTMERMAYRDPPPLRAAHTGG